MNNCLYVYCLFVSVCIVYLFVCVLFVCLYMYCLYVCVCIVYSFVYVLFICLYVYCLYVCYAIYMEYSLLHNLVIINMHTQTLLDLYRTSLRLSSRNTKGKSQIPSGRSHACTWYFTILVRLSSKYLFPYNTAIFICRQLHICTALILHVLFLTQPDCTHTVSFGLSLCPFPRFHIRIFNCGCSQSYRYITTVKFSPAIVAI